MSELLARFAALPGYGIGGLVVLVLYMVQTEIRFGSRARAHHAGQSDRRSTRVVTLAVVVPVAGFVLAMKSGSRGWGFIPRWFRGAVLPGLPAVAWAGVGLGICGVALRLWAVLKLRERYTRTLLVQAAQVIERGGPYRWVRHPGYLGSLLSLNGIALASGNAAVLGASLLATGFAYRYRIRVEDEMLVAELGPAYAEYRKQVRALWPFV